MSPTAGGAASRSEEVLLETTRLLIRVDTGKRSVNMAWLRARLASDPVLFPPTRKVCAVTRQRLVDLQRMNYLKMQSLWQEYSHSIKWQRERLLLDISSGLLEKGEAEALAAYLCRVQGRLRTKNPLIGTKWILSCGDFLADARRCFQEPPRGRFEMHNVRDLLEMGRRLSQLSDLA
jgi:hypothetical protein